MACCRRCGCQCLLHVSSATASRRRNLDLPAPPKNKINAVSGKHRQPLSGVSETLNATSIPPILFCSAGQMASSEDMHEKGSNSGEP